MRENLREVGEALLAALHVILAVLTGPVLRRWRTRWGATRVEAEASWPGDEFVPEPRWGYTYGTTIDATPHEIWPWLVQMGQGRGGFYSHTLLENIVGCRMRNVDAVVPELQDLAVGDPIHLHPKAPHLTVGTLEKELDLVYVGDPMGASSTGTAGVNNTLWGFHLRPAPGRGTRLVVHGQSVYGDSFLERLGFGPFLMEPISYVMHRKMLATLEALVEAHTSR